MIDGSRSGPGSFSRDALLLFASRVLAAGTTLVVLAAVARLRTPEDLGLVAIGLTLGLALAILPEAGMTALYIREVVRAPQRSSGLLGAMLAIRAISLPIGIGIAAILAIAIAGDQAPVVLLVALGPAVQQVGELGRATFLAHRRIPVASVMSIVENLAWVAIILGALAADVDLAGTFAAADLALVIAAVAQLTLVPVVLRIRIARPSRSDLAGLLRQAGPFAGFSALALVALRSDTVFIGLLLPNGLAAVGAYYAATRIAGLGEYVSEAIGRTVFPELARHYPGDPSSVRDVLRLTMGRAVPLGILMASGLAALSGGILALLYGDDYRQYAPLLTALAILVPIRMAASLAGVGLTSVDAQGFRTQVLALAVVISSVLYIALIPAVGISGAVVGLAAAWVLMAIVHIRSMGRRVGPIVDWPRMARWGLLGIGLYVICQLIVASGISGADIVAGLLFGAIAFPALWTLRRATADPEVSSVGSRGPR
jgi:O-antigen/teichoic acid export membrane protein